MRTRHGLLALTILLVLALAAANPDVWFPT
jgi:hypothetical protein